MYYTLWIFYSAHWTLQPKQEVPPSSWHVTLTSPMVGVWPNICYSAEHFPLHTAYLSVHIVHLSLKLQTVDWKLHSLAKTDWTVQTVHYQSCLDSPTRVIFAHGPMYGPWFVRAKSYVARVNNDKLKWNYPFLNITSGSLWPCGRRLYNKLIWAICHYYPCMALR